MNMNIYMYIITFELLYQNSQVLFFFKCVFFQFVRKRVFLIASHDRRMSLSTFRMRSSKIYWNITKMANQQTFNKPFIVWQRYHHITLHMTQQLAHTQNFVAISSVEFGL